VNGVGKIRTLLIDIETRPNLGYIFDLWNQNISPDKLTETVEMISFASKWLGDKKVEFRSNFHDGHDAMVARAHELLDEAEAVVHYNGRRFDVPHLNREFWVGGFMPPSPFKQIDLYQVVKKNFKFPSNKLDHISQSIGLGGKVKHEGFSLWVGCMAGDPKAWAKMKTYNSKDTALLEPLYLKLLPWVQNHPNLNLYHDTEACPKCGSDRIQKRGFAYTGISKFQQYNCQACGGWFRGGKRIAGVELRSV